MNNILALAIGLYTELLQFFVQHIKKAQRGTQAATFTITRKQGPELDHQYIHYKCKLKYGAGNAQCKLAQDITQ